MRLDWLYQGPNDVFIIAQQKGFYKEVGLDVDVGPGKGSGSTAATHCRKAAQFGFSESGFNEDELRAIYRENATRMVPPFADLRAP